MTPDLRDLQRAGNVQVINGMMKKKKRKIVLLTALHVKNSSHSHNRHMAQGIATRLLVEGFLGSSLAWVRIFYRKRPTYNTFLVESALRE